MKKLDWFYFPNRDNNVQINTIKIEDTQKLKTEKKKPEIKPPIKVNKKSENLVKNLKKNIKDDVEKHICKANDEIRKIRETADEKTCKLKDEDAKFLENCQKDSEKAVKEADLLLYLLFKIVIELENQIIIIYQY